MTIQRFSILRAVVGGAAIVGLLAAVSFNGVFEAIGSPGPSHRELLPDLDQAAPAALEVQSVSSPSGRSYELGFLSAVSNVGDGPLILVGSRRNAVIPYMRVDQLVARESAQPATVPVVGRIMFAVSPGHDHWHYLNFDRYQLLRAGSRSASHGRALVSDQKTGFCLGDRYPAAPPPRHAVTAPVFTGQCGLGHPEWLRVKEGISVGWGDDYPGFLEGQELPIDGLPDGRYLLVHRVNVNRQLRESSYTNNAASVLLSLRWRDGKPYLRVLATCPDSDQCAA